MTTEKYDIRHHLGVLTPAKGSKTKYHCPVTNCNGSNLDISKDGAYSCFSGGCESKDIRAAIDKLEGVPEWKPPEKFVKSIRSKFQKDYFYPDRDGNQLVKVTRIDDGKGGKKFYQNHWDGSKWEKGNPDDVKKLIPIYRYAEVQQAIERKELIFKVEGESIADLLWDLGIAATTTIGGSGCYGTYGDYLEDLKGARLVLAPDKDDTGIKYIANIERDFPSQIEGYYLAGTVGRWERPEGGMDIGDDIRDYQFTKEQILEKVISPGEYQAISSIPAVAKPKSEKDYQEVGRRLGINLSDNGIDKKGVPYSKLLKLKLDLFDLLGDRLKFNEMSREIELDKKPIDLNIAKDFVSTALEYDSSTEDCIIALNAIATNHKYHPVQEYLKSLRGKTTDLDLITNFPRRYFGNSDPLQNRLFFRKLIASVARVMKPGTKDDSLLVLQGKQGAGKSTALKALAGDDWFNDDLRSLDDKDEIAKLSRFWVLELAEVDYLFGKKEVELFKRFLSCTEDTFRPPYGRANILVKRSCSLFATTNKSEFLTDPTGDRRYWVVEVKQDIDIEGIRRDRDLIWATALAAYESGHNHYLDASEQTQHNTANTQWRDDDPWADTILPKLGIVLKKAGSIEYVEIQQIMDLVLGIPVDRQDKRQRNRIGATLQSIGFERTTRTIDGKPKKVWGREISLANPSNPSLKDGLASESLMQSTFNPSNPSNPSLKTIEIKETKDIDTEKYLPSLGVLPKDGLDEKDGLATTSNSNSVSDTLANPSANPSLKDGLLLKDGLHKSLKVGDKVRYIGGMLKYKGKVGKITKVRGEDRYNCDFVKSPIETIPLDELESA